MTTDDRVVWLGRLGIVLMLLAILAARILAELP